jgi:hypothetical protein
MSVGNLTSYLVPIYVDESSVPGISTSLDETYIIIRKTVTGNCGGCIIVRDLALVHNPTLLAASLYEILWSSRHRSFTQSHRYSEITSISESDTESINFSRTTSTPRQEIQTFYGRSQTRHFKAKIMYHKKRSKSGIFLQRVKISGAGEL